MISDDFHNFIEGNADANNRRRSSSVSNVAESVKRKMALRREESLVHNEEEVWLNLHSDFME